MEQELDTGADIPASGSGLANGGADGTGKVRARNPRAKASDGSLGDMGSVVETAPDNRGRMEVAYLAPSVARWHSADNVYVRLARAQEAVRTIQQDATIEVKKEGKTVASYKGVTSAQVVTFAKRALLDNGIVFIPMPVKDGVHVSGNKTAVWISAVFACVDNDSKFETGCWGAGTDFNDKDYAKAYTNAVKIVLSKVLMMSTLEDESEEATPHEPEHKPKAVKIAEALTDVAIKTWADAYKSAIDGCKTVKALQKVRAENAHMMNNTGVPQVTKDYFIDKIAALEGTLE